MIRIRKPAEFEMQSVSQRQILAQVIFTLFFLPPPSPATQPTEHLWPPIFQYPVVVVVVVAISLVVASNILCHLQHLFPFVKRYLWSFVPSHQTFGSQHTCWVLSQQPVTTFLNMVSIPFIALSIANIQWSAVPILAWAWDLVCTSMCSLKKVKLPPPFCFIFLRLDQVWGYTVPLLASSMSLEGFLVMGFTLPPGTIVDALWCFHLSFPLNLPPWSLVGRRPTSKEWLSRMNQHMMSPQMCRPSDASVSH